MSASQLDDCVAYRILRALPLKDRRDAIRALPELGCSSLIANEIDAFTKNNDTYALKAECLRVWPLSWLGATFEDQHRIKGVMELAGYHVHSTPQFLETPHLWEGDVRLRLDLHVRGSEVRVQNMRLAPARPLHKLDVWWRHRDVCTEYHLELGQVLYNVPDYDCINVCATTLSVTHAGGHTFRVALQIGMSNNDALQYIVQEGRRAWYFDYDPEARSLTWHPNHEQSDALHLPPDTLVDYAIPSYFSMPMYTYEDGTCMYGNFDRSYRLYRTEIKHADLETLLLH